jgi:ATP-dependent DNA helicase RecQ (EC 3.6.1.-)
VEAKDLLLTAIEAVIALKEKFKTDYVINILRGKETSR